MSPRPSAAVIVPVYNGADTIAACVESLLRQSLPRDAYEILVVENGSNDATSEIAGRYPVQLLHSDPPGLPTARNHGIAHTDAEIVAFTDADCIADPSWLAELLRGFTETEIGGVGGPILPHVHPNRSHVERFAEELPPLVSVVTSLAGEFLPHLAGANCSYRRALLERIGGFDPTRAVCEDVDAAWRLQLETGARLASADGAIVYHHHRSTSRGLARQYRRYGFGEILLDTYYRDHAGYPRTRRFQMRRILQQLAALPRYMASAAWRRVLLARGRTTPYEAKVPLLMLLAEGSCIYGKVEALIATRMGTDTERLARVDPGTIARRFFSQRKD